MALKVLHTADWHLGQIFHHYSRNVEQQNFLNWLMALLTKESVDVMLLSGDVFDSGNPSPEAQKLYYYFLAQVSKSCPNLQIIITAGNHDSVARLEAPKQILRAFGISVVGRLKKNENNTFNFEKCCLPMFDVNKNVKAYCLAIPFLRPSDFSHLPENYKNYAEYVAQTYKDAYQFASETNELNLPIIAMGHMHARESDTKNENRKEDRNVIGGAELIPSNAFDEGLAYVALGHIHKAQHIGARENIRYSGSPIPMSFTEKEYDHQVIVFELSKHGIENLINVNVPITAACISIPKMHEPLENVLLLIEQLPNAVEGDDVNTYPFVCCNLLKDEPDPTIRYKIEEAIKNKRARFVKIDLKSSFVDDNQKNQQVSTFELNTMQPQTILENLYQSKYNAPIPANLVELFKTVKDQIEQD